MIKAIANRTYECNLCQDNEWQIVVQNGQQFARECSCVAQKRLNRRMQCAMIPAEFEDAELAKYQVFDKTTEVLLNAAQSYLAAFDEIKGKLPNSLGFLAKFGEAKLKEITDPEYRAIVKKQHNNFGLGKTHLQVAIAKELIKRGHSTLVIADVIFMEQLSAARAKKDDGEEFEKLVSSAISADMLVWDDMGKAKSTEFRSSMYFRIIDERYRARKPILFSTNEDIETLTERIGDAAASRLFGMAKGRLYPVEGQDYRLTGN